MLPRTHGTLLTAKRAHLSVAQRSRLDHFLAADVELAVVWAIKAITVQLLATRTGADFEAQWQKLDVAVRASDLPEPAALFKTLIGVEGRDPHVLSHTGHQRQNRGSQPNAKNIKRAGRGYVNHHNDQARFLLAATVKNAA